MRSVSQSLSSSQSFSIAWDAYVTNYSDPSGVGVVLQEVETKINNKYNWFSFYYYGGNTVNANGSSITLDMSISHTFKIVISYSGKTVTVNFFVDGSNVNSIAIKKSPKYRNRFCRGWKVRC